MFSGGICGRKDRRTAKRQNRRTGLDTASDGRRAGERGGGLFQGDSGEGHQRDYRPEGGASRLPQFHAGRTPGAAEAPSDRNLQWKEQPLRASAPGAAGTCGGIRKCHCADRAVRCCDGFLAGRRPGGFRYGRIRKLLYCRPPGFTVMPLEAMAGQKVQKAEGADVFIVKSI